jgi:hypothetical protein
MKNLPWFLLGGVALFVALWLALRKSGDAIGTTKQPFTSSGAPGQTGGVAPKVPTDDPFSGIEVKVAPPPYVYASDVGMGTFIVKDSIPGWQVEREIDRVADYMQDTYEFDPYSGPPAGDWAD